MLLSSLIAAFLIVLAGLWYLYGNLKVNIEIPPSAEILAAEETVSLNIQPNKEPPFAKLKIFLLQGNKTVELYSGDLEKKQLQVLVKAKEAGFRDGKAELIAEIELPFKREIVLKRELTIDTTPPQVAVLEKPHRLVIGEPGVVAVKASPDTSDIYVEVGKARFPFIPEGGNLYKTVITAPLFLLKQPDNFYLVATDEAGNTSKYFLPVEVRIKKFRKVKINLTDKTLQRIVLKFFPTPDNALEKFRKINTEFRQSDEERLVEICSQSVGNLTAEGRFLQLPGSKPTSYYGDHRYYYYKGKLVGESVHKGLDLAKYRHAPVVASNSGRVVFAGKLKVYGNAIVIDHGYGVFTLYGHMNDFSVKVGDTVKKGQIIGHTDTTGLALGDHLHFGVLVWGYAANPIFFFDGRYLKYYFYTPLKKTSP